MAALNADPAELRTALASVVLMRRFDERVLALHDAADFPGHYHVYFGQEVTGAAAIATLGASDYLLTTHRNHGHLLARGADPRAMLAEILGKATGINRGLGGTFHLSAPELGVLHTSAVVGSIVPLAVGVAFGAKRAGTDQVTLAIFGEGSLQEGASQEGIMMAALHQPPVVFLVENNDAESQAGQRVGPYTYLKTAPVRDFGDYARIYDIPAVQVDGTDYGAVRAAVAEAVARARHGGGPTFIESRMFRWPGQFGSWPKLVQGPLDVRYAWEPALIPAEFRQWWDERDPVIRLTRDLLDAGVLDQAEVQAVQDEATNVVDEAERFARESPFPDPASVMDHVYATNPLPRLTLAGGASHA